MLVPKPLDKEPVWAELPVPTSFDPKQSSVVFKQPDPLSAEERKLKREQQN